VWDPIDVISSERGIKDLKSQRPESISGSFISKGRVVTIEAIGEIPTGKPNRHIGIRCFVNPEDKATRAFEIMNCELARRTRTVHP
jgi:hypothetical protein